MRVYRGRADSIEADRAATDRLREHAADGDRALRVWRPHPHVAFGRRDADADGFERACKAARSKGYPPVERSVGGRAVAYEGTTVAFVHAVPIDDPRRGLQDRYDRATDCLEAALREVGVDPTRDEPPRSFCPGSHSLSVDGRKIVGLAQRVVTDVAIVAGIAIPRDRWPIAEVLEGIYDALDLEFDPGTLGSVRSAGGEGDPDALATAIEEAVVGDRSADVEWIG